MLIYLQYNMTALLIASFIGYTTLVRVMLKVPGVDANFQDDKVRRCSFGVRGSICVTWMDVMRPPVLSILAYSWLVLLC